MPLSRPPLLFLNMSDHSFSRTFAKKHSINEAIVLELLAFKTQASNNVRENKQWFYDTTDELHKKLPFLGRSTIDDVVRRLQKKKLLLVRNYNKASFDKTRWFHVPKRCWKALNHEKVWFRPSDAETHGVPAALLMFNLEYWLGKTMEAKAGFTHEMSPEALATGLPLTASNIKATLTKLVKENVLVKIPGKKSEYAFDADRMREIQTLALTA